MFPATAADLYLFTSTRTEALLLAYELPTAGTDDEKINRIMRHIGRRPATAGTA